ncbi:MAG: flagellar hook-associated 2 protein [Rickettsiaceae bacterium]|jgi:flagellar hook-associated protein 2|nr:flagellar hook-associated 2 protein [Rickettsiaceae bacterium]
MRPSTDHILNSIKDNNMKEIFARILTYRKDKHNAYKQLEQHLKKLHESVKAITSPIQNVFDLREVSASTNEVESWNHFINVEALPTADLATHQINILQVAKAKNELIGANGNDISTQKGFSSKIDSITKLTPTAGEFKAGTFQINGEDITLQDGDSLLMIKDKINELTTEINVKADIVQATSTDFRLILKSTLTGTGAGYEYCITDRDSILDNVGRAPATTAQDAIFKYDGIECICKSNIVSDVIDKVKITLINANTDNDPALKHITFSFAQDRMAIKKATLELLIAYNDFLQFVNAQQKRDIYENLEITSYLGNDKKFIDTIQKIKDSIGPFADNAGDKGPLALIGILLTDIDSIPNLNILEAYDSLNINETLLDQKINFNLGEFESILKSNLTGLECMISTIDYAELQNDDLFIMNLGELITSLIRRETEHDAEYSELLSSDYSGYSSEDDDESNLNQDPNFELILPGDIAG